ncbi:MAG TPA: sodium-translocating pyrophosphatase [archaeon]|nr:sodium-translocating pyrophosphatase [archaeon]
MALELVIGSGILALLFAVFSTMSIMRKDQGTDKMKSIAKAISVGANAFLNRQYKTVAICTVIVAIILYAALGSIIAVTFVFGALLSAIAGYIGMHISIRSNVRTAQAATNGVSEALRVAFLGGSVNGFSIVGLGILGMAVLYIVLGNPMAMIGFGFGASLVSLFARVGGGIFTKAADVGGDLVGKVEKGIPEDDPRNPATIADAVGDNVGDCAGMGADLFESYVVTLLAAMLLGNIAMGAAGVMYALAIAAVGIIASLVATFFVRTNNAEKIWPALNKGIYIAAVLTIIGSYFITVQLVGNVNLFLAVLVGIIVTVLISQITEYYTATTHKPVQNIANASETGAATNIITGLATGMQSTILPVIVICAAILISFSLAGVFGIALAALGLLSITGIIMSIDSFGPISDNAGGIAEMSKMPEATRKVTDALDAIGNTTKATTKGVAIASAALSALALFAAFAESTGLKSIDLLNAKVLVGLLIGGAIPFLFSAFTMQAVGKAANLIVIEVRRQFKEIKGIMSGKAQPDYGKVVDISTKAALHELAAPALIAVLAPVVIGLLLGPAALGGMLAGSIASGLVLALMLANSGASWDNAKKYIESGKLGGKGSFAHKAAVVGDTVGDPCKDTSGPAINSLIKVMNTIALVLAPLIVAFALA